MTMFRYCAILEVMEMMLKTNEWFLFKSSGQHSITHHQASPSDSTVDVQQGAVILFEDLRRPQTAVDVRPLILAKVQQPARLLKQHHCRLGKWHRVIAANPVCTSAQSTVEFMTHIRFTVSIFLAQWTLPLVILGPSSVSVCLRRSPSVAFIPNKNKKWEDGRCTTKTLTFLFQQHYLWAWQLCYF